jgi:hypothetical protein
MSGLWKEIGCSMVSTGPVAALSHLDPFLPVATVCFAADQFSGLADAGYRELSFKLCGLLKLEDQILEVLNLVRSGP